MPTSEIASTSLAARQRIDGHCGRPGELLDELTVFAPSAIDIDIDIDIDE